MSDAYSFTVEKLARKDISEASLVVAAALQVEPGFAFVVPDERQRAVVMQTMLGILIRDAFPMGNVWIARDGRQIVGTAVWYAPGDFPMTIGRNLRAAPVMLPLARFGLGMMKNLAQMGKNLQSHFPTQPCWYLSALGVAPNQQGKGVGSQLMRAVLREIDQRHEPAYLETGEEANVRFYQRHGFEIRDPGIQMAPAPGPTHWTMWRDPQ